MTLLAHIHAMLIYIREGILQYSGGNERAAMHDGVGNSGHDTLHGGAEGDT